MPKQKWTEEEIELLREKYPITDINDLVQMFPNYSRGAIYTKANKIGLNKSDDYVRVGTRIGSKASKETIEKLVRSHTPWTEEQENLLKELYPTTKSKDLESVFPGFSAAQIQSRARQIGARKPYSFFVNTGMDGALSRWSDDYEYSDYRGRGKNWRVQRRKARKRAGYKCEWCGASEESLEYELCVHHIIKFSTFGYVFGENENYKEANRMSNLIALCRSCHQVAEHLDGIADRREMLEYIEAHRESRIQDQSQTAP